MLERDLDPGLPVVELGGCIGVLACIINKRLTDPTRHFVVEANPQLIPALMDNCKRNECRFRVISKALAYGSESVRFSVQDEFLMNRVVDTEAGVRVKTTTFRNLLDDNAIAQCTLICDIEGNEYGLVTQELDLLARSVRHLVVEVHPKVLGIDKVKTMLDRLQAAGFSQTGRIADTYAFHNQTLPHEQQENVH